MSDHHELAQAGVNIAGVALRLEDEQDRDHLADYRRRRGLSDSEASEYAAGIEIGAAWVREEASAAALSAAYLLAEHGGPWTALPALATSLRGFLTREADESRREACFARFSPETHSWDDESPYAAGIVDVAGAAWAALRDVDRERAVELANPYAPANRAACLAALEDETGTSCRLRWRARAAPRVGGG